MLRYLPTNLSAREIAGELYLSVNTVKTQQHLYQNLARAGVPGPFGTGGLDLSRTDLVSASGTAACG